MATLRVTPATGMTLVEVLVVILIIALMTTLAVGSMRSIRDPDTEVDRLALVLDMAAERARVRGTPLRFELRPHGYRFSRLDTSGEWQAINDDPVLAEHALPIDVSLLQLLRDGQEVPQGLVFGSDIVLFTLKGTAPTGPFTLTGQANGSVKKLIRQDAA